MIGLLWHKYRINYFECYKNSQEKKSQLLFFKDWFLLHNKQIEDTEQYNSLTHQYIHEMESINN